MINLKSLAEVQQLQANLRGSLGTDAGKEVMKWLEEICGWYDFSATDTNQILMKHGARQCLATIKTLLEHPAETVVQIAQKEF